MTIRESYQHERARDIQHLLDLLDAHEKLDALRHAGEFEARRIAALDIDRRLEAMNEFRAQITNERGQYLLRDWYEREHMGLSNRIRDMEMGRSMDSGFAAAHHDSYARMLGIGGVLVALLGWALTVALHFWK